MDEYENKHNFITTEIIASLPNYTEGPAMDSEGNIYFTTLTGGTILKIDSQNKINVWAKCGCPNGQIIINGGDHLVCDVKNSAISRFDRTGKFIRNEIAKNCAGFPFTCPNDLVTDHEGSLYFTDSVRHSGKVCCISRSGDERILLENLDYPNGIIFSHDEEVLYVAESYKNRILKISLKRNGEVDKVNVFANLPVHKTGEEENNLHDGLAVDYNGNIWVAHYGMKSILQLSPSGKLLRSEEVDFPLTSNLFFADKNMLIVTGGFGEPGPGGVLKISL